MSALIDITPAVTPALAVFPGDVPPRRDVLLDLARGDHITLSSLTATVHLGAHVDAPSHYGRDGRTMERQPLDLYVGPCQVIACADARGRRVALADLAEEPTSERILLATGTYPDPERWNDDFAGLEPDLVDALAARGVRLVGVDTPSVDPATAKALTAHARFLAHDMAILEGIVLAHVEPGEYELIALPLKLAGFDGSPVRAVLRRVG